MKTTRCTVLLENRRTTKIDGHFLFPLASFLNGCLNFQRIFDNWIAGNVAAHAIAKSGSRYGGAGQRDRSIADELPMGPGGGASSRKGDTASRHDLPPLNRGGIRFRATNHLTSIRSSTDNLAHCRWVGRGRAGSVVRFRWCSGNIYAASRGG
jgi:hypothetical protein